MIATLGLHGLGQVSKAPKRVHKWLWSSLVASAVLASVYSSHNVLSRYFDNYAFTVVTTKRVNRLRFPTIIICPKNADALNETLVKRSVAERLPDLEETVIRQLVAYAIAGADIDNMDRVLKRVNDTELARLREHCEAWKGDRSSSSFYDTLFSTYGYTCEEMFERCKYGWEKISCCDIFRPTYVMLRGRCFQLRKFYQYDPGLHGNLVLDMKQLPSWLVEQSGVQPTMVVFFIAPDAEPANFYRRFYLAPHLSNRFTLKLRHYKMLDSNSACYAGCKAESKLEDCPLSTCFYEKWLQRHIRLYNCTIFYVSDRIRASWWFSAYFDGLDVCDPDVVLRNYRAITSSIPNGTKCLPACERYNREVIRQSWKADSQDGKPPYFSAHVRYADLEYDNYEEVQATTVAGLISELGGQSNLFIGASLLIVIHVATCTISLVRRGVEALIRHQNGRNGKRIARRLTKA